MAMLHGRTGTVTFAGAGDEDMVNITSWTAEANCDMAETTHMSDANYWKQYLPGFKDWTATVEVNSNSASFLTSLGEAGPDALVLTLASGGNTLTGNAYMTNVGMTTDANDIIKLTYSYQGSGALAWG